MIRLMRGIYISLLRFHRLSLRYPKTVLGIWISVVLLVSAGLPKLQFLMSIDDLIDPDFKTYQSLKQVNGSFKDKNSILLSLESEKLFTKKYLCDLQTWILNTAQTRKELIQINSSFGVRQPEIVGTQMKFESHLNLNCETAESEEAKIRTGLEKIRLSPWADLMSMKDVYNITLNFTVYDPADLRYGSIDTKIVGLLQESYDETFGKDYPEIKSFWGGVTTYQSYLRKAFDHTQNLNGLMFIVGLLLFRIMLGSWKAGFIFNFLNLVSMFIIYGIMGLVGYPVDALSNATGLMMTVACLEDFVFVAYGVRVYNWTLRKSMRRFLVPAFFTSLTTLIGFESLGTSDLSIITRFGYASGIAAMLEWLAMASLLPALVVLFPKAGIFHFTKKTNQWVLKDFFKDLATPKMAWGLVAVVVGICLFPHRLTVKDSPADFFTKDHIVSTTTAHFEATRNWSNEVSLLLNKNNEDEDNKRIINLVKADPFVQMVESSYDIESYLTHGQSKPDQRLIKDLWRDSIFSKRLIAEDDTLRAEVFLKSMDMDSLRGFINKVGDICPEEQCDIVGSIISYNEFSERILGTLFTSLGTSLILVCLIIFSLSSRLTKTELIACIVASVWGPLALLSIFIAFKIPLFFVTCICASVVVGLAGDNAIQFILSSRNRGMDKSVESLTGASLIVTIGMICFTMVFFLATVAPVQKLGVIMIIGFLLGYIGDVWILSGLLKIKRNSAKSSRIQSITAP